MGSSSHPPASRTCVQRAYATRAATQAREARERVGQGAERAECAGGPDSLHHGQAKGRPATVHMLRGNVRDAPVTLDAEAHLATGTRTLRGRAEEAVHLPHHVLTVALHRARAANGGVLLRTADRRIGARLRFGPPGGRAPRHERQQRAAPGPVEVSFEVSDKTKFVRSKKPGAFEDLQAGMRIVANVGVASEDIREERSGAWGPAGDQMMIVERKTISIMKACELVGVSRRTIYNWIAAGKVEYVRTAGGSVRIFVDTLWRSGAFPVEKGFVPGREASAADLVADAGRVTVRASDSFTSAYPDHYGARVTLGLKEQEAEPARGDPARVRPDRRPPGTRPAEERAGRRHAGRPRDRHRLRLLGGPARRRATGARPAVPGLRRQRHRA